MEILYRKSRCAWDEPGHTHYVTYSCVHRWPLLSSARAKRWVVQAIDEMRKKQDAAVWAYVVMPEHVHILLHPRRPEYQMRSILAALKYPVARAAKEFLLKAREDEWLERLTVSERRRRSFRFWQPGGGFDHNVFKEKTVLTVMDYIHANPVRRELAATPEDWEWSSARFWEGRRDGPLDMDDPDEFVSR